MTQHLIAVKNGLRYQHGLRCRDFLTRIKEDKDKAIGRGEQAAAAHTTRPRDYANMIEAFKAAEENHIEYLLLQGKIPGNCDEDQWLADLCREKNLADEPPDDPMAGVTGMALTAQLKLSAIASNIGPRVVRVQESTADLADVARHTMVRLLNEVTALRGLVNNNYLGQVAIAVELLPQPRRAAVTTAAEGKVTGWLEVLAAAGGALNVAIAASPPPVQVDRVEPGGAAPGPPVGPKVDINGPPSSLFLLREIKNNNYIYRI